LLLFLEFFFKFWEIEMIESLDTVLWKNIFQALNLDRENVARQISMVWDKHERERPKLSALGIFYLKDHHFILIKGYYFPDEFYTTNTIDVALFHSFAQSNEGALLEFLPNLSQEERDWLMLHLHLRNCPAYQG